MKNLRISLVLLTLATQLAFAAGVPQAAKQKQTTPPENQGVASKQATAPGSTKTGQESPKAQSAGVPKTWQQVPIPKLPAFHPQQPKRIVLDNGMIVFLQEDHELPLIGGSMTIRGGGTEVPAAKTGMMEIYGSDWRLGGTEKMTGDQMDDFLESRAARVSTGGGMETTSLSFSCLKQDFKDVFALAIDLLQHPAFREDKITLTKTQLRSAIARRNDDIESIVGREMGKIVYGPDNPYGRTTEYDTVAAVTREDLLAFHKQHVNPANIILGVSGDFDSTEMEATLRQAFASWPKGQPDQLPKIEFRDPPPGLYFAEKSDVDQSQIRMAHLGIEKNNPDLMAVDVMDWIYYSGGFSSRIMNEIRTRRGLAYDAGGSFGSGYDHPGLFYVSAGTKSPSTVEAIQGIKQVISTMDRQRATEDELKRGKDAILNSFIFSVDTPEKVLSERMTYEFYGYPADFLERYRAGVEKVTAPDVARVAQKYIHPDKLATLVVGNSQEFGKPLTALGPVKTLDISIPPPGSLNKSAGGAAAKPANTPEAKALLAKAIEALGGAAKLAQVKSFRQVVSDNVQTPGGEVTITSDSTIVFPDHLKLKREAPQGSLTLVIGPNAAFAETPQGTQDLPGSLKQQVLEQIRTNAIFLAQHAGDPNFSVSLGGREQVGGVNAQALDISYGGARVTWFVDPATGRIERIVSVQNGPGGPVQATTDMTDWKPIDGVMFAFSRKNLQNGQPAGTSQVKEVQVNPTIDPKDFEKPQK